MDRGDADREIRPLALIGKMEYRSIQNMEVITGETRDVEYVGTRTEGRRRYLLYKDTGGMGWYRTQILTEQGWQEEEEAIFGKKIRKKKSRQL